MNCLPEINQLRTIKHLTKRKKEKKITIPDGLIEYTIRKQKKELEELLFI